MYVILVLAVVLVVRYLVLNKSQTYNEWLDERAYAQLTDQLAHTPIERFLVSIQQRVVQRYDVEHFDVITYHGSLWNQEDTLKVGITIIAVDFDQAEDIFFYDSNDPNSNVFHLWYKGRTFAVEIPSLKRLANEVRPLLE
ncbi:hypothetical protein [Paenibacillus daejeonensis]|uniref:hypothetical protein n=1 Tax=Paenibacillus daejeonensis TaxID=135193 RepID=UPI0003787D98|nr:hypothetical protein [Paenibacillus daejeonensis]